jgi:hypothetical protein
MGLLGFFIDLILPTALRPGVDSASKTNEYQRYLIGGKGSWCIGLTTLLPSNPDCLEILTASTSWSSKGLFTPLCDCFTFSFMVVKYKAANNNWCKNMEFISGRACYNKLYILPLTMKTWTLCKEQKKF